MFLFCWNTSNLSNRRQLAKNLISSIALVPIIKKLNCYTIFLSCSMKNSFTHHFDAIVIASEFYGGMKLLASSLQHKHYLKPFITQPQEKIEKEGKKEKNYHKNTDAETELWRSLLWLIWGTALRFQAMCCKISFYFMTFFFLPRNWFLIGVH